MKKIINYKVVSSGSPSQLGSNVSDSIIEGWQPHGSMAIAADGSSMISYHQAMVKYEN